MHRTLRCIFAFTTAHLPLPLRTAFTTHSTHLPRAPPPHRRARLAAACIRTRFVTAASTPHCRGTTTGALRTRCRTAPFSPRGFYTLFALCLPLRLPARLLPSTHLSPSLPRLRWRAATVPFYVLLSPCCRCVRRAAVHRLHTFSPPRILSLSLHRPSAAAAGMRLARRRAYLPRLDTLARLPCDCAERATPQPIWPRRLHTTSNSTGDAELRLRRVGMTGLTPFLHGLPPATCAALRDAYYTSRYISAARPRGTTRNSLTFRTTRDVYLAGFHHHRRAGSAAERQRGIYSANAWHCIPLPPIIIMPFSFALVLPCAHSLPVFCAAFAACARVAHCIHLLPPPRFFLHLYLLPSHALTPGTSSLCAAPHAPRTALPAPAAPATARRHLRCLHARTFLHACLRATHLRAPACLTAFARAAATCRCLPASLPHATFSCAHAYAPQYLHITRRYGALLAGLAGNSRHCNAPPCLHSAVYLISVTSLATSCLRLLLTCRTVGHRHAAGGTRFHSNV